MSKNEAEVLGQGDENSNAAPEVKEKGKKSNKTTNYVKADKAEKVEKAAPKKPARTLSEEEVLPELYVGQEKRTFVVAADVDKILSAIKEQAICRGKIRSVDGDKAYVEFEGARGVIPKDALGAESLKNITGFVGRPISFVILGYDKESELFAASRVQALEMMKTTTFEQLKEGDIRAGVVVSSNSWGCLMDLGGVLGRLGVADMDHHYIPDAREYIQKGEYFDVVVKRIFTNKQGAERIVLNLKDLIPNAWAKVGDHYRVGQVVLGKVTGFLNNDSVFIEFENGVEALADIPMRELAVGQEVRARVGKIDLNRHRIRARIVGVLSAR